MKLTYVWHDCFVLETARVRFVFDYWQDPHGVLNNLLIDDKPVCFLVSHHHKDHFSKDIFLLGHSLGRVHYVLSKDTARSINYILKEGSTYRGEYSVKRENVSVLRPGDVFNYEGVAVYAFGSTDVGNSYLLNVEGRYVFHAGDLNAWVWKDESSSAEIAASIRIFNEKLDDVGKVCNDIFLAMFPVDSRLGRDYWEGASIFVRRFKVCHFVPMHFELGTTEMEMKTYRGDAVRFDLYGNDDYGSYHALKSGDELVLG